MDDDEWAADIEQMLWAKPPRRGDFDLITTFESEVVHAPVVFMAMLLAAGTGEPPRPAFERVHVAWHIDVNTSKLIELIVDHITHQRDVSRETIEGVVRQRVRIAELGARTVADVVRWSSTVPEDDASVILGAARLVVDDERVPNQAFTKLESPFGDTTRFVAAEHYWAPRVIALVGSLRERSPRPYLLVVAGLGALTDPEVRESVHAHFDAVFETWPPNLRRAYAELPNWIAALRENRDDTVLAELEALVPSTDLRAQLTMQAMAAASRFHDAWEIVVPHLEDWRSGTLELGKLATVALYAGQVEIAEELFDESCVRLPSDLTTLLSLHDLAIQLARSQAADEIFVRLDELAPNHPRIRRLRIERAVRRRDWGTVRSLAQDAESEIPVNYLTLLGLRAEFELGALGPETFVELISSRAPDQLEDAVAVLTRKALDADDLLTAANMLDRTPGNAGLWIELFERLCLDPTDEARQTLARKALAIAIAALASEPTNVDLRRAIAKLLEGPSTGTEVIVWALERLVELTPRTPLVVSDQPEGAEPRAVMELLQDVMTARRPQVSRLIQPEPISVDALDDEQVEYYYWGVYAALSRDFEFLFDGDDPSFVTMVLKLGVDIAARLDRPLAGLDLMWLVAVRYADRRFYQLARNMAEEILEWSKRNDDPQLRRRAWLDYADVYLRCKNPLEALLATSCALEIDVEFERPQDRLASFELGVRLLRELSLPAQAIELATRGVELTDDPSASIRIRFLLLSTRFSVLSTNDPAELKSLVGKCCDLLHDAIELGHETRPALVLLVQLQRICRKQGQEFPDRGTTLVADALAELPPDSRERVQELGDDTLSVDTLLARALAVLEQTAYHADVTWDRSDLNFHARRVLASVIDVGEADSAFLVVEVLADLAYRNRQVSDTEWLKNRIAEGHRALVRDGAPLSRRTVEHLGGPIGSTKTPTLTVLRKPEYLAQAIDEWLVAGLEIHALAVDEVGRAVHVRATRNDGRAIEILHESVFSVSRLQVWSTLFPHGLVMPASRAQLDDAEVQAAMAGIELGHQPERACEASVFATSVGLASIPLNLILRGGELAGSLGPVARVPSLAWLIASRSSERPEAIGEQLWLPATGNDPALELVRTRLPAILAGNEIRLVEALGALRASALAVVVAHGALDSESQQVASLRDGLGRHHGPEDLASILAGSRVVVLLVCSGGRVDSAPLGSTTTGLPRMLLDRGVATVVAAPWLLDVGLALHWLEYFVRAYADGRPVATAVHEANLGCRASFPEPVYWLAMHVFGDPLIRR